MPKTYRSKKRSRKLTNNQRNEVHKIVKENIETKDLCFHITPTAISTTVVYHPLLNVMLSSQGAGQSQFIGNEVRLQYLRCRGVVTQSDRSNLIRCLLVRMKDSYLPGLGDVDMFKCPAAPLLSELDFDFVDRVYYDKTVTLNVGYSNDNRQKIISRNVNLRNRVLTLKTTGNPNQEIFWVLVSDSGIIPHPSFEMTSTLGFNDA